MGIESDVHMIMSEAGWAQATNKAKPSDMNPFCWREPAGYVINGTFDGIEHCGCRADAISLANDLIAIGLRMRAERETLFRQAAFAAPPVIVPQAPPPEDPRIAEMAARIAELESREPEVIEREVIRYVEVPAPEEGKFPASLNEKLSDWGEIAADKDLTQDDLMGLMREDADSAQEVIGNLSRDQRRRFTELLNVELAELQQVRGAAGENLKREADIEQLLGLFARVGEM